MDEIQWLSREPRPEKAELAGGLRQWVRCRTGIENADLMYAHQLTFEDTVLLAWSAGYQPPAWLETNIRNHFRWKEEELERQRARIEARATAPTFRVWFHLPGNSLLMWAYTSSHSEAETIVSSKRNDGYEAGLA